MRLNLPPANIPSKTPPCMGDGGLICEGQQTLFSGPQPILEYEFYNGSIVKSTFQAPLKCMITDDYFKNGSGFYRWNLIREAYHLGLINEQEVKRLYLSWRDHDEYFIMDGFDVWGEYGLSVYGKCSKRGNDVYKHRVNEKFNLLDRLPPIDFIEIFPDHRTPMIFVTLTVDPKRFTLKEAWSEVGKYLHRFESSLRQQYGPFVKLRVWEAHKSGYPHVHATYYFKKCLFLTFPHKRKKDGKIIHRIPTKHKNKISGFWGMTEQPSGVDVQAVTDTLGSFSEIKKYVTKDIYTEKGNLTNAMLSLFRKQQYSISKDFIKAIWGNTSGKVKDRDLKNDSFSYLVSDTVHNCNKAYSEICDFRFSGVLSQDNLEGYDGFGKPPPLFDDKDYNLFRLFGSLDESKINPLDLYSGTVRLTDEGFRFVYGLTSLESVSNSKLSLLCCWFSHVDNIIVDHSDINQNEGLI